MPWVLGAYFAFTIRNGCGLLRCFLGLSVVIDRALLFGLIWSFRLQYMQPPAFSLKAPTLLYVPIFISLRALRFEAGFVVLAGIVAAVGWTVLVLFAVLSDPTDDIITQNCVHYMTSASVLIGAEFDKILSILVATLILALAIQRPRLILVGSALDSAAARDLSRFFTPEVAERIKRTGEGIRPGEGDLRDAAILYGDVRGFTPLTKRLAPSTVMKLLAEYESLRFAAIQKNGGSIDKFLSDGMLASFGAVVRTDTYAADPSCSVDDLVTAADRWADERRSNNLGPFAANFAVAVGAVVFGAAGDETRLEYTVIGDPVNLAAKIEKHNKIAGTRALSTIDAYQLARRQGFERPEDSITRLSATVDGIVAPLKLAVLAS